MVQRATFEAAAVTIFNAFGDLIEGATYASIGEWNPLTESNASTQETVRISINPVTRAEKIASRGGGAGKLDIMDGDLSAKIIQSEITATPKIDDRLTLDSVDYIVRSATDNHGVLWELELRRL